MKGKYVVYWTDLLLHRHSRQIKAKNLKDAKRQANMLYGKGAIDDVVTLGEHVSRRSEKRHMKLGEYIISHHTKKKLRSMA